MYQRHAASSRESAAIAAPAQRSAAARIADGQGRLGRDQAGPAEQLALLAAGRVRPGRVRLVGHRRARGQQPDRLLGGGQGHRRRYGQLAFRLVAVPGRDVQIDTDAGFAGQPVPRRPPRMTPGPRAARSLLTSVATFCSAAAGGCAGPQHIDDPVHGNQARPFHGEQLQQQPGLTAADFAVGKLSTVASNAERARETQLNTRTAGRSRGSTPPHPIFIPPARRLRASPPDPAGPVTDGAAHRPGGAGRPRYGRTSKTRLKGVSAARRNRVKPASVTTCRMAASPACAPSE